MLKKTELVIHPVRLRIMQVLSGSLQTTQEIADALPSIPKSSIYRHMAKLLEGDMVEVAETRQIRGTEEKVYRLKQSPHLSAEDVVNVTPEEHLQLFTFYTATLLQGFAEYLDNTPTPNLLEDRAGYTEIYFHATDAEFEQMAAALNRAIFPLTQNPPGGERKKRKLATITHPIL